MAKKILRLVGNVDFSAAAVVSIDLPRENPIVALDLELDGSLDIDATNTNRDETPLLAIRNLEVVMDGEVLQSWSAAMLYAYNYFMRGVEGNMEVPAAAVADPEAFRAHLYLPFKLMNSGFPGLTYLDPTRARSFQLRVTWDTAAGADIVSAGTMDYNLSTHLTVKTVELQAVPRNLGLPNRVLIVKQVTQQFSAASIGHVIELQRDNDVAGILVRVSDTSTGFVLSDTLLNALALREAGIRTTMQGTYNEWQNLNNFEHRLAEDYTPGTPTVTGSRIEGFLYVNTIEQGISDLVKPQGLSLFDLVLDTDASTQIDLAVIEIARARR